MPWFFLISNNILTPRRLLENSQTQTLYFKCTVIVLGASYKKNKLRKKKKKEKNEKIQSTMTTAVHSIVIIIDKRILYMHN